MLCNWNHKNDLYDTTNYVEISLWESQTELPGTEVSGHGGELRTGMNQRQFQLGTFLVQTTVRVVGV